MNISTLKKIFVLLTLLALGMIAVFYGAYTRIRDSGENISVRQQEIEKTLQKQRHMDSMQQVIVDQADGIGVVRGAVVPSDGDVQFIEQIESLARSYGLDITIDSLSFEDNGDLETKGLRFLKLRAKMSGSWVANYTFLAALESLSTPAKITAYGLSANIDGGSQSKNTVWQGVVEMKVLKYK